MTHSQTDNVDAGEQLKHIHERVSVSFGVGLPMRQAADRLDEIARNLWAVISHGMNEQRFPMLEGDLDVSAGAGKALSGHGDVHVELGSD